MNNIFRFLILRLKNTSCAELVYRVREWLVVLRHKILVRHGKNSLLVPIIEAEEATSLNLPSGQSCVAIHALKGFLQGATHILNDDARAIERFEARVQKTHFSCIDQEQGEPDIRAVWEPARLQQAATLLHHAHHNPTSELAAHCRDYAKSSIFGWIERTPFLYGPHYKSAMECGLRVPVFFSAVKCLTLDERENATIFSTIYHHAWWIEKRLSLYSSLGNHTVCESLGLVFAGALFRKTAEGKRWLDRGIQLLRQELHHQILPDGGPAEQSLNYHRFVLDLYWVAVDFLETNGLCDCSDCKPKLRQGETFLATFLDAGGNLPSIGDSDDGYAIAPGIIPKRESAQAASGQTITFPDAGCTVIRQDKGMLFTFDHGPLGMAPLYNHGHADALSITLSLDGEQLLVDPGTYRYNGVPEHRKYFKGTRAHNTVTIDGFDQAVQETGFIWSNPYITELVRSEDTEQGILLEAVNDGYARLKQPVKHKRTILFADGALLLIKDTFIGRGIHGYELNFHLHPDAISEEHAGWWHMQKVNSHIDIRLLSGDSFTSVCGEEAPLLGWYSPAYGIKQKSVVLQARKIGCPDEVMFVTAISLTGPTNIEKLEKMAETL